MLRNTYNLKELRKELKNMGIPCKVSQQAKVCLRENELLQYNKK